MAGDKWEGRQLFDDKLMQVAEYTSDGVKGGVAWKNKLIRYFTTKVPALGDILKWAEKHDKEVVSEDAFDTVVGHFIDRPKQDAINAAIWGFLAGPLSGTADTYFRKADDCNGLDAWRRVVRVIDNGLPQALEELRDVVRDIHRKPTKDLEGVPEGVAKFEQTLKEYSDAGGDNPSDRQKKSDLGAAARGGLCEERLWRSAKLDESFEDFKDFVTSQATNILFNRKRHGGLHLVEPTSGASESASAGQHPEDQESQDGADTIDAYDANGTFIGAFNRFNNKGGGKGGRGNERAGGKGGGKGNRSGDKRQADGVRRTRLCPNCNKENCPKANGSGLCKEPTKSFSDRSCFICGEKHLARDCPNKDKQRGPIKAIEDRNASSAFFGVQNAVTDDGYRPVVARGRPRPQQATLGDFIKVKNTFAALKEPQHDSTTTTTTSSRTSPSAERGAKQITSATGSVGSLVLAPPSGHVATASVGPTTTIVTARPKALRPQPDLDALLLEFQEIDRLVQEEERSEGVERRSDGLHQHRFLERREGQGNQRGDEVRRRVGKSEESGHGDQGI